MEEGQDHIVGAIRQLREQVRWRRGRDVQHLAKRIALGHLQIGTTVAEYDTLIMRIVNTPIAEVFAYRWGETIYPTVVAEVEGIRCLVMMSLDSIMETAFPPEDAETYLANPRFQRLGTLEELGL